MTKYFYALIGVVLVSLIALAVLTGPPTGAAAAPGSVIFSHAKHKDLAECGTCHTAATSESATDNLLPKPETCASCHEQKDVRTFWSLDENAALDKEYLPHRNRHLRFSHKFHVEKGGLKCEGCHGAIVTDVSNGMPQMETCYECHNDGQKLAPILSKDHPESGTTLAASKRCESCHTTLAGLLPKNHLSATWQRLHGRFATSGEAERECAVCHSSNFCQECHTPTNDVPAGVAKDKFYLDDWPRAEKMDDGKELTVQSVHSLTYRYTHGFDARAQSTHCERCHEIETFCTPCHQNGYDGNGEKIVPQSHQLAGFVTIGGGRAMNRHARLAEADITSCATCHNVDGGDPICATCHSTGLVKGGD